jgi:hypothetical protein
MIRLSGAKRAVFLNMARARRHYIPRYIRDNRQEEWINNIAVGSRSFVENVRGKDWLEGLSKP